MILISGNDPTSSRLPALSLFFPEAVQTTGTAADSLLEEAVTSEPVSEAPNFPVSWENTGNLLSRPSCGPQEARNSGAILRPYEKIPYALEQGIYFGLTGN
jgi:hypothetical protein